MSGNGGFKTAVLAAANREPTVGRGPANLGQAPRSGFEIKNND